MHQGFFLCISGRKEISSWDSKGCSVAIIKEMKTTCITCITNHPHLFIHYPTFLRLFKLLVIALHNAIHTGWVIANLCLLQLRLRRTCSPFESDESFSRGMHIAEVRRHRGTCSATGTSGRRRTLIGSALPVREAQARAGKLVMLTRLLIDAVIQRNLPILIIVFDSTGQSLPSLSSTLLFSCLVSLDTLADFMSISTNLDLQRWKERPAAYTELI